jgi:hypothetical protein
MKNAGSNDTSNDQAISARLGKLTSDPAKDFKNSGARNRPTA